MTSRPVRPSVIDLDRLIGQTVRVKFTGGREMTGTLRGHDPVPNLLLEDTIEWVRNATDPYVLTGESRRLGSAVLRGTSIVAILPEVGFEGIENPFVVAVE